MWSYYGSKKSIVDYYPPPKHDTIIEPFVGAGPYALKYWDRNITIIDKYEVIYKIWKWLQECEISDIEKLPHHLTTDDRLDNYKFDCIEARYLMGFIIKKGDSRPANKPSSRAVISRPNTINFTLNKIKGNLEKIKNWNILHGCYKDVENKKATWFIDPPYQFGGHAYIENQINFQHLAKWCTSRDGQIIVCENTKADWLPFKSMVDNKGTHKTTTEAIWTNYPTSYGDNQISLFN